MRILFLLAAFVLLSTFAPPALQHREPPPPVSFVRFAPVALDSQDPGLKRLGRLVFLGAWALTSNDPRIGRNLGPPCRERRGTGDERRRMVIKLRAFASGRRPVRAGVAMVEGPGPRATRPAATSNRL